MDISSINANLGNYINTVAKDKVDEKEFETLLKEATAKQDDEVLKEACQEFEAYYLQQVFKEMRKTVPESGLFEKSAGREIYEDMLYEEYAKEMSKGTAIGLADMLYKQLSKDSIK